MSQIQVYTSIYDTYRGGQRVNIMRRPPVYAEYDKAIPEVYPPWELIKQWNAVKRLADGDVKKEYVKDMYIRAYLQQLERVGIDRIASQLKDGDVLLCNCRNTGFCHRHVLAGWLSAHGIKCMEVL